ncbi:MAG: ABC transporter substrate-binding protein [Thermomicrobiales bacterium]|nr:ABC transporter substrate-binding protein [Thermomicrobiales bacterium]
MSMSDARRTRGRLAGGLLGRAARVVAVAAIALPMVVGATVGVAAQDAAPLKIGALFPFTGDLSDFGPGFFNAAELAVTQINEAGGVNGQPVELIRADSATSPQQSVEEARRLIDIEGVDAIIGPAGSGSTLQVVESVTGPEGVVVISPSATSPALTHANDNGYFFRTTISDAAQGVVMADLAHEQGYQTACVMYTNNAYGQGLDEAFANAFTAEGGKVLAQVPHEQEQASYASELATCTKDNPDVLIGASYPESGRVYLRELAESGKMPALILSDGLRSEPLFEEIGWDAFAGVYGTSAGSAESAIGEAFQKDYEAKYGALPSHPYLREVYDAVYLIALAAQEAGSNDSTAIRDHLRDVSAGGTAVTPGVEGFKAAIAALANGEDIDFEGATGPVDFDENGDVGKGVILVWQVVDGAITIVDNRPVDLTGAAVVEATPAA